MKKHLFLIVIAVVVCGFTNADAQSLKLLRQVKMSKWNIPPANYSGITYLGGDRYAVVCDKQPSDGFYEFRIQLNEKTGRVENIERLAFHQNDGKARDAEDICYVKPTGNFFIAAENDQRILEYDKEGALTGRELHVPESLGKDRIYGNYGFESLAYSDETALFWTCTENSLRADGDVSSFENLSPVSLRLQSFGGGLQPSAQYLYQTDAPVAKKKPRQLAYGVTALACLDDGRLLVLEREFSVANKFLGSFVINKLFLTAPSAAYALSEGKDIRDASALPKTLLAEWKTRLNASKKNLANYEGMCLGPKLKDGRQTILFVSDSQAGFGNSFFHLKDYLRVGILEM